ncbi:MAG: serine hydroxymethyltransferase [Candidatus Diapherotrites archaeon]|nr:serine hydroxymethyltransferase [Candidatus Diapherotrites archaeon]
MTALKEFDSEIYNLIEKEKERQMNGLELIPSENFVSLAVLEANGSILTNKYSEGYSGKRYYGGCQIIDGVEDLAIDRAKKLFGAEHVNVQPLSGAPANIGAYFAILEPGDTVLGMDLSHGGHLTHGHPITYISKIFNFQRYKTDLETGLIDFDNVRKMAKEFKPKLILCGYSAYSRDLDYKQFKEIADEIDAYTMADIAHIAGLIAAGKMNNPVKEFDIVTTTTHKTLRGPRGGMIMCKEELAKKIDKSIFPGLQGGPHENLIAGKAVAFKEALQPEFKTYAEQIMKNAKTLEKEFIEAGFKLCFNGTENHLILMDVTSKGLSGKEAEKVLDAANITLNKNMIPDDPRSPMDPSGVRFGTPSLTTRGMKEKEMKKVAQWMIALLENPKDEKLIESTKKEIKELCNDFIFYK